jgi:hypothetical protein
MKTYKNSRVIYFLKCFILIVFCFLALGFFVLSGCRNNSSLVDEAKANNKTLADYPEESRDLFKGMDSDIQLTADEIKGRNTWLMWTAGNQAFWNYMAQHSYGLTDLLKTIDSRKRPVRFKDAGLVNEPGFRQATKADQYGLWLDEKVSTAEEANPDVYGKSSGVIGFRLFPNPEFNDEAKKNWNAERYYTDASYYNDPKLIRPYRVGMSCAACHVTMHPIHPPADPENPDWSNLSSNIGNQYMRVQPIFGVELKPGNFLYELLDATPRGTLDTSLIATDNNNNPNAMNPIFNVGARLEQGVEEQIEENALRLPPTDNSNKRKVPHILMDGADSIGIYGALDRVFINIGEFHEEWLRHHNLLVGLKPQTPIEISKMQADSVYWQVTEKRVDNLAKFFLKSTAPMHLEDAPGGKAFVTTNQDVLNRGKTVFAENCMTCHSSKQPANIADRNSEEYKNWARAEVMKPDFRDNNYLSTEQRIPVTRVQTNAGRALGDNATSGHVWDNFSSGTYKSLPSVGEIDVYNPFDGTTNKFKMPEGGPGYYRVPTLVSIWATAPYFHNNSLGEYTGDPSVAGRMRAFDDAITKLLWTEKRKDKDSIWVTKEKTYLNISAKYLPETIAAVTGYRSRIILVYPWLVPLILIIIGAILFVFGIKKHKRWARLGGFLVVVAAIGLGMISYFLAGDREDLVIGPIPKGTPINLLANLNANLKPAEAIKLTLKVKRVLHEIKERNLDDNAARDLMRTELAPELLKHSKSPDFIEDRGHYFGTQLPDDDKKALIEFLKTF